MMLSAKRAQNEEQRNSSEAKHTPTDLISIDSLLRRLRKSKEARTKFVESHLDKSIAFQIRSLRDREGWTQGVFAEKLGITHPNNVSARLENPHYGKHSLTTLKKIAATCDVALVVWFVPFSRLLRWVTGTPYSDNGLSEGFYDIPTFHEEYGRTEGTMGPLPETEERNKIQQESRPQSRSGPDKFKPQPSWADLGSVEEQFG